MSSAEQVEIPWVTPGHEPGDPCPCVAGYFPWLDPTPKPIGGPVPDRTVRTGGYAGAHAKSDPKGGAGVDPETWAR